MHCNLGVACYRLKRLEDAVVHYRQALRFDPNYAEAHNNLGNALRSLGKLDPAIASLREAIRLRDDFAEAHLNLAQVLAEQGKHEEAADSCRRALQYRPEYANARLQLGNALTELKRYDEAADCFRRVAANHPEALFNLANCLRLAGKLDEAIASYRELIRHRPEHAESHNNLGVALAELERFEEAEASLREALKRRPGHPGTLVSLGVMLSNARRFEESQACLAEAIRIAPDHMEAHRNRALTWLLMGDFERGWPEYEWRLRRPNSPPRRFKQPAWDGTRLAGRTILLYTEQGFGDTIQFVRYAKVVQAQGGRVVVEAPLRLLPLLRSCGGIDALVAQGAPLPSFDVHASLMSLPFLLGAGRPIPADIPYLNADEKLVDSWGKVLGRIDVFKVGIAWRGSPGYGGDRTRSIPLRLFAPLAKINAVQLVSLQKGLGVEELAEAAIDFPIVSFDRQADERAGAFMDTAAIIRNLDLVITCDSAIGHLAGALGAPTWLLLSYVPDWRWMLDREDSPWYPTLRLFRQKQRGDWEEIFGRVAEAIEQQATDRLRGEPVLAGISLGELIDKITILEIKKKRIGDPEKVKNISYELEQLRATQKSSCTRSEQLDQLTAELRSVNEALWDIEDEIRRCEGNADFGKRFIELARSVYEQNDRRSELKRTINDVLSSRIVEEKSYSTSVKSARSPNPH
jgi:tetratricopeptide (TPR) repeat protein